MTTTQLTEWIESISTYQNLIFLASLSKSRNALSIDLHWAPSAGCLRMSSCLRSSLCHCISLAFALFLNKCFNCGIIGKYHITFVGTLFLGGCPSTSSGLSRLILYHSVLHTGQASNFLYSSP